MERQRETQEGKTPPISSSIERIISFEVGILKLHLRVVTLEVSPLWDQEINKKTS